MSTVQGTPRQTVEIDAALPVRLAGACAVVAFVVCVVVGGFTADNPTATVLWRALVAMAATFAVGLVVGHMAKRLVAENVSQERDKLDAEVRRLADEARQREQ